MLTASQRVNKYGAKFFIGQLVRIVDDSQLKERPYDRPNDPEDIGKVGIVDGIVCSDGRFEYALGQTESNKVAWFRETSLDFVGREDRAEWWAHGKVSSPGVPGRE